MKGDFDTGKETMTKTVDSHCATSLYTQKFYIFDDILEYVEKLER